MADEYIRDDFEVFVNKYGKEEAHSHDGEFSIYQVGGPHYEIIYRERGRRDPDPQRLGWDAQSIDEAIQYINRF